MANLDGRWGSCYTFVKDGGVIVYAAYIHAAGAFYSGLVFCSYMRCGLCTDCTGCACGHAGADGDGSANANPYSNAHANADPDPVAYAHASGGGRLL